MVPERKRLPRWLIPVFAVLLLAAGASLAAWAVELPYAAFSPGPVGDVVDTVVPLDGLDLHQPQGELLMLTVSYQEVNAYEMLVAAFDPTVDVVRRELVRRPGETDEEFQQRSLRAMDVSVETAIAVALDRLGLSIVSDGVEIVQTIPDYPSAEVLRPGDVIHAVDGTPVVVLNDIAEVLSTKQPGETVTVEIERDGTRRTVSVELGVSSADSERAILGVQVQNLNPRFPVTIHPGNIGGPSAGMMYSLAVIDLLTEEDLSHGRVIAGTGTIAPDGSVGPIGGIRQKVVAAEAAGAEIMLVPADNYEEALTAPRSSIELVAVATIDEALTYLEGLEVAGQGTRGS